MAIGPRYAIAAGRQPANIHLALINFPKVGKFHHGLKFTFVTDVLRNFQLIVFTYFSKTGTLGAMSKASGKQVGILKPNKRIRPMNTISPMNRVGILFAAIVTAVITIGTSVAPAVAPLAPLVA